MPTHDRLILTFSLRFLVHDTLEPGDSIAELEGRCIGLLGNPVIGRMGGLALVRVANAAL